jgi:glycosyltransferase involved in cell wall biosynthesis
MRNWNVTVIPNALDTNIFKPIDKILARNILGFPLNAKLILFGAVLGTQLSYKGWDLLQPALAEVAKRLSSARAIIFGQGEPKNPPSLGMPLHWMGHLHDDATLTLLYSASDVVVIPSRQENLPQLGTEAHACGRPVVAFNSTGLRDVVEHGVTGYLAEPYSILDLAKGLEWVLDNEERQTRLAAQARQRAVNLWSNEVVVPQYLDVYRGVIDDNKIVQQVGKKNY